MTYHGIDRETRVPETSSGCIIVGYEPFVFIPNNFAVKLWTNLFGYQRGSYKGIFPTEEEAKELMQTADAVTVKRMDKYFQFSTANQLVQTDTLDFHLFRCTQILSDSVKGKIINNECFLLQQVSNKKFVSERTIYLIDIQNKKLLTQYLQY